MGPNRDLATLRSIEPAAPETKFLGRVRDALSAAERQLFLQAWHLRQLLPERPAGE